ncbi:MAG: hypothetical protein FWE36_03040 [Erysipelotrichales bacterium]|nr:hypothetical protein [Erysipelotrichales bacterium]
MNEAIQKRMQTKKAEVEIFRAVKKCTLGYFERLELEELDASYQEIEDAEIAYENFSSYLLNGEVVFVRVLNPENGFGKEVLVPEKMSEEEYNFIVSDVKEKDYPNFFFKVGLVCLIITSLIMIVSIVDNLRTGLSVNAFLVSFYFFAPPIFLSIILLALCKFQKKDK